METEGIKTNLRVDKVRVMAGALGSLIGKQLLILERGSGDLKHSDRVKNNELRLNRELNLWSIKKVLVTAAKFETDLNGYPAIVFNENAKYSITLDNTRGEIEDYFPKITAGSVAEVYKKAENEGNFALFVCHKELADQVVALNTRERENVSRFAQELINITTMYDNANKAELNAAIESEAMLGLSDGYKFP